MAIRALYCVDIVRTLGVFECRVHRFDVDAAVGELRMASCAGRARGLSVLFMAGEATEAFMDSDGRAIIAGTDLRVSVGCVALVAERLALVGADLHRACAFKHVRERQTIQRDVVLLAAVEQR